MNLRDIKLEARESLRGNWLSAIFTSFVASLLGASTMNYVNINLNFNYGSEQVPESGGENIATAFNMITNEAYDKALVILSMVILGLATVMAVYGLVMFIIGSGVSVGYCQYNLDLIDGRGPKLSDIFARFDQLKTVIVVKILTLLRVLFGYILFIIPGIIATYSCSMAYFVLADNPDMTASEALRESRRIMKGHKWELFCLELSFIGWIILSVLTFGIGLIWLVPYFNAAHAAFYRRALYDVE